MRGEFLAVIERAARMRQIQGLLDAANRMEAHGDEGFAAELRASAFALNGDADFSDLRECGRCKNAEILIRREVEKAARLGKRDTEERAHSEISETELRQECAQLIAPYRGQLLQAANARAAEKLKEKT